MSTLLTDLRYGTRMLAKSPAWAAVAVLSLALGIGANTVIFSVLDATLLRPLPWPEPDRLVRLWESNAQRGWPRFSASGPNFVDWEARSRTFDRLAAWQGRSFNLSAPGGAERVGGGAASAGLFDLLGAHPALGRAFLPEEDRAGGGGVVVLGHDLWMNRLGGDPGLVGRAITLDGASHTVVGVLPAGFPWIGASDAIVPLGAEIDPRRGHHILSVFGRLRRGVEIAAAQVEMETISRALAQEHPDSNDGWSVATASFDDWILGPDSRRALLVMAAAVGAVLLIACANVAALLLARAADRGREIAVRAALGAGRGRLLRQLLTESVLLSAMGGALGLALAVWGVGLVRATGPATLARLDEARVDLRVMLFTAGVSMLTGILFGLAPALQASQVRPGESLGEAGRGAVGRPRRWHAALVAGEVALSIVLLVGAGLLARSLWRLGGVDPGFSADGLVTMQIHVPPPRYGTPAQYADLFQRLLARIGAQPGVQAAAAGTIVPFGGGNTAIEVHVEGRPADTDGSAPSADWRMVTPDYFGVLEVPVRSGRVFTDADAAGTPEVLVVNETMARRYWPGADPLGRRIRVSGSDSWVTVVGIVGDTRNLGLDSEPRPTMYIPAYQYRWSPLSLLVRASTEPGQLLGAIRAEARALDPELPVSDIRALSEMIGGSIGPRRFNAALLAGFAAAALALAATGLYGVLTFSVSRRTREIGVRMALGARARDVTRLIVGEGLRPVAAGAAIGMAAALLLARLIESLLFGVGTGDPLTFAAVPLVLGAACLAACWLPARRAARVDPMVALRQG